MRQRWLQDGLQEGCSWVTELLLVLLLLAAVMMQRLLHLLLLLNQPLLSIMSLLRVRAASAP